MTGDCVSLYKHHLPILLYQLAFLVIDMDQPLPNILHQTEQ